MREKLKNASHHFEFQYPPKREDAVNMLWRQVKHKIPNVKLDVHRNRRDINLDTLEILLYKSKVFNYNSPDRDTYHN
ncbi:unnamed protein product [Cochlearia groenlandica]